MLYLLVFSFLIILVGLFRSVLIVMGLYKTPIIRSFEFYGPHEVPPMPIITLLLWMGAMTALLGIWGVWGFGLSAVFFFAGLTLLMVMVAIFFWRHAFAAVYHRYAYFPRWYYELREYTSRYERRRIAYMWLMLPRRSRLIYNSSDQQFRVWADFIILGTTREEEKETFDERFYMGQRR
jgi:hypothetical protein